MEKKLFKYKGTIYLFLKEVMVKDRSNGKWYSGIEYQVINEDKVYIRELVDFYTKFKPVE